MPLKPGTIPRNVSIAALSPGDLLDLIHRQDQEDEQTRAGLPGEVVQARITDAFAFIHSYITGSHGRKPLRTTLLSPSSSLMPIGAKAHAGLMPGTEVLAWYPGDDSDGIIILGARPPYVLSRESQLPPRLVQVSRVGWSDDIGQNLLSSLPEVNKGIVNASAGRPVDAIAGEWGYTNELGLAIHLGKLMAFMKGSETAGLYVFNLDDLVRLWSYNFEHFTAGSERYAYDDESEFTDREGSTPYPWEALGCFGPMVTNLAAAKTADSGEEKAGVEEMWVEPKYRDQAPIWRRLRFNGFLGGMSRDVIQAPSPTTNGDVERYSRTVNGKPAAYPGLLEIFKGMDGRFSVRSAKEITFEKIILIPAPKQQKLPADPTGDFRDNFSASGVQWNRDGVQTPVVPELEEFDFDTAQGAKIAQLLDYHTYMNKIYGVQGFRLHSKDWNLADEQDLAAVGDIKADDGSKPTGTFGVDGTPSVASQYYLPMPKVFRLKIDHRTSVAYYQSRSCIKQLDDGSVLIEDGWGSQIKMSGGHIVQTAALDILNQPGRSFVAMAPSDVIMRAGNSVDVTAAHRDVRIKAERNLHMLGGNSGKTGGILIEDRGPGDPAAGADGEDQVDGGITLKATASSVRMIGKKIEQQATDGMTVDAGSQLAVKAAGAFVQAPVTIDGAVDVNQNIHAPTFNGGVVGDPQTAPYTYIPDTATPAVAAKVPPAVTAAQQATANAIFTLRTAEQYQLDAGTFVWWEHRWQQYFRRSGSTQKTWDEPPVGGRLPYPGVLWNSPLFNRVTLQMIDKDTGMPKRYADIKTLNASGAVDQTTVAAGYLIASQGRDL